MNSRVPLRRPPDVASGMVVVTPSLAALLRTSFGSSRVSRKRKIRLKKRDQPPRADCNAASMTVRTTCMSPMAMVGSTLLTVSQPEKPWPDSAGGGGSYAQRSRR